MNTDDDTDGAAGNPDGEGAAGHSFEGLGLIPELVTVCVEMGWQEPTPIQEQVIPIVLKQQDLYGIAQTGTGKTGAYALPVIQLLCELDPAPPLNPYCVMLAPTRELAQQIAVQLNELSTNVQMKDGSKLRVMIAHGGTAMGPQMTELNQGVEILVAAPGRLLDLMRHGWLQYAHFKIVVLDEADRMFDMGFIEDLTRILNRMPARRQTLLFSATMPPQIKRLTTDYLFYPEEIRIGRTAPPKALKHFLLELKEDGKYKALRKLLQEEHESVLVFVKTRSGANDLTRQLLVDNERVSTIHADRSQREREQALQQFKDGDLRVLVATDVASRGLDIEAVDLVVNYDVPGDPEDYVHRVGRTARAQKSGLAVTFITPRDGRAVQRIERFVKQEIERRRDGGDSAKPRGDDKSQRSGGKPRQDDRKSRDRKPRDGKPRREGTGRPRRDGQQEEPKKRRSRGGRGRGTGDQPRAEQPRRDDKPPRHEDDDSYVD